MKQRVLITCGAGASSGFLAASARKAAKKLNFDIEIKAKSETEVEGLLQEIDILLVAPHLAYMLDEMKEQCKQNKVRCDIIPQKIYGALDGKGLLEFIDQTFGKESL